MKPQLSAFADLYHQTVQFWLAHLGTITLLMLPAAIGRAIQMDIVGPVSSAEEIGLEVMVEAARLLTLAAIVGHGHPLRGFVKLAALARLSGSEWNHICRTIRKAFQLYWPALVGVVLCFGVLAVLINKANGLIAAHPGVIASLSQIESVQQAAVEVSLFFFLKNLTIIPLTLVFDYCLVRWLMKEGKGWSVVTN